MTTWIRCVSISTALIAGACCWTAGAADDKAPAGMLPEAEYPRLVDQAIKTTLQAIQGVLGGEKKFAARYKRQARAAALMIAAYAQNGPAGKATQRATLRDAALQLITLMRADKWAEARQQTEALKTLADNPSADPQPIALLPKHGDIQEVMQQFSSLPGGLALERDRILTVLSDKTVKKTRALPESVLTADYVLAAYQMATIADLIKDHQPAPAKGQGAKEWQQYSAEMRQLSLELAGTAAKKDGKTALTVLQKLNSNCRSCHEVFRPME